MKYIKPERWPTTLLPYLLGGLAAALGDMFIRAAAWRLFRNEALGTWFDLVVTLPVLFVLLAVAYPHIRTVMAGVTLALGLFAFLGDFGSAYTPSVRPFGGGRVAGLPVALVLAWPVYLTLAVGTVLLAQRRRRVGAPPAGQCAACGYSLHGLPEPRCPECGTPFELGQKK